MGNEQSCGSDIAKARHSLDASMLVKTRPAYSSPRLGTSESSSSACLDRLNNDCSEVKAQPKLSVPMRGGDFQSPQWRRSSRTTTADGGADTPFVDALKLTLYQVQLLSATWPKIKANGSIFAHIFKKLISMSPTTREMFQKMSIVDGFRQKQCCELNTHARVLFELLDNLLSDLQKPSKVVLSKCKEIGASHVVMSEKCLGTLFDQLGECLTEVFTQLDCVRSKREAVKAWIAVLSFLVDGMKGGYTEEWSKRRRQASSSLIVLQPAAAAGDDNQEKK